MTTAKPLARLTWLHISDFHLREKSKWQHDVVLRSLVDDIAANYSKTALPELLFLTGDVAFSGKAEEYAMAEEFVAQLAATLSLSPERIFIVPGNHDIDRDLEEDAFVGARHTLKSAVEVDRFFGNEGRRKTLFRRQQAFRAFANKVGPAPIWTASSHAHSRVVQLGAIRVRVLLLDSTWLCEGGETDAGAVLVGERQVLDCVGQHTPDGTSFTFALMHHPFAWLNEFEQVAIETVVLEHADLCLRGHVHASDLRAIEAFEHRLTTLTAGAAFQTRESDNRYMWCSLDLITGEGEKIEHRYKNRRWEASAKTSWRLLDRRAVPEEAAAAWAALEPLGLKFSGLIAALVAGLITDVPHTLPNGSTVFMSIESSTPGCASPTGDLVRQIQNLLYWRSIWDATQWSMQLKALAGECDQVLSALERAIPADLNPRARQGSALITALVTPTAPEAEMQFVLEVRALLSSGETLRARAVVERWKGQLAVLRDDEQTALLRIEAELLVAELKPAEALAQMESILSSPRRTPRDNAYCARCAFEMKDYKRAASEMHAALDAGLQAAAVRILALQIAGLAGDARLTQRVRK